MRQLKYIGVVFAALMLFTACEKEFDAIPEDYARHPKALAPQLLRFPRAAMRLGPRR